VGGHDRAAAGLRVLVSGLEVDVVERVLRYLRGHAAVAPAVAVLGVVLCLGYFKKLEMARFMRATEGLGYPELANAGAMDEFLMVLDLTKFAVELEQLGASEPWHLKYLEEEDLRGLGFKKLEMARFMRATEALGYPELPDSLVTNNDCPIV
jgi:hypothetical protein